MALPFPFVALHHPGGEVAEDTNFVQKFIDSESGVFLASLSHTFGALLFTAGIALYLYQARLVRIAKEELEMPSVKWLPLAHILTILGVGMNGIGGLMRLKQGDHPGLEELGASSPEGTWVTVLLVKHIFLVVGVGLAMLLTAGTFWLARKPNAPANFLPHANRMTFSAVASFLTIIAATVFGVIAQGALLPMAAAEDDMAGMQLEAGSVPLTAGVLYQNFTGSISGTAADPGEGRFDIIIPQGVSQVRVILTWESEASRLDATLVDQNGTEVSATKTVAEPTTGEVGPMGGVLPMGGRRVEFLVQYDGIPAGIWTLVVTSDQASNEPFRVVSQKVLGAGFNVLEDTITVRGGLGDAAGAYEVNLQMQPGSVFYYEWWVEGSEDQVYFDIHTHEDGEVQYPVQGNWNKHKGNYTHELTEFASLMWLNENPTPVTIHFLVRGDFEFDSIFSA